MLHLSAAVAPRGREMDIDLEKMASALLFELCLEDRLFDTDLRMAIMVHAMRVFGYPKGKRDIVHYAEVVRAPLERVVTDMIAKRRIRFKSGMSSDASRLYEKARIR